MSKEELYDGLKNYCELRLDTIKLEKLYDELNAYYENMLEATEAKQ